MEKGKNMMVADIGMISTNGNFISINEFLKEYDFYEKTTNDKILFLIPKMVNNEIANIPILIITTETNNNTDVIVKTSHIPYDLSNDAEFRKVYDNFLDTNTKKHEEYRKCEKPLFMDVKSAIMQTIYANYELKREENEK